MSRRKTQLFNLSFLDLLTSALGAVIFLFIITPKGGQPAADVQQATVYLDTAQMKIHGKLHDSLWHKRVGDTLFTVLVDYQAMPKEEQPKKVFVYRERPSREVNKAPAPPPLNKPVEPKPKPVPKEEEPREPVKTPVEKPPVYRGDAPSVPASVSFEINWLSREDNVDLFVCKGNDCVYGARKRDRQIGQWDSGKSRNRLFGNDLRTNQEAVRQFDEIIPGTYKLYAQFKESKANRSTVSVRGLIYTKDKQNQERGESFSRKLKLGAERTLIGTVVLKEDGSYQFRSGSS